MKTSVLALFAGLLAVSAARATIISVAGSGVIIAPPALIGNNDNPLSTAQQGFNERQGVLLVGPLAVDGGAIAGGNAVDSHMIFFNQSGQVSLSTLATWTFSGSILGVMSDLNGTLEAGSSAFLGSPTTLGYPAPGGFSSRGMETNDSYIIAGNTLTVRMNITQPGDWIRVITRATPEGGTAGLMLAAALSVLAIFRRRRA